jgi:hypothetical protein
MPAPSLRVVVCQEWMHLEWKEWKEWAQSSWLRGRAVPSRAPRQMERVPSLSDLSIV